MDLVLRGAMTDKLFILLAAQVTGTVISVAHMGGLWTSKKNGVADVDDDIFLVYTTEGFHHLLLQASPALQLVQFHPPDDNWMTVIPILEGLVENLTDSGFFPKPEPPVKLLKVLSTLAHCTQQQYRQMLISWIVCFPDFNVIAEWLSVQELSWPAHCEHLESHSTLDGLELLLALMAMRFHLNLLHSGGLWTMRRDGSQNSDPTLAWTDAGFVFCDWIGQEDDHDSDPDLLIFHSGCVAA